MLGTEHVQDFQSFKMTPGFIETFHTDCNIFTKKVQSSHALGKPLINALSHPLEFKHHLILLLLYVKIYITLKPKTKIHKIPLCKISLHDVFMCYLFFRFSFLLLPAALGAVSAVAWPLVLRWSNNLFLVANSLLQVTHLFTSFSIVCPPLGAWLFGFSLDPLFALVFPELLLSVGMGVCAPCSWVCVGSSGFSGSSTVVAVSANWTSSSGELCYEGSNWKLSQNTPILKKIHEDRK